MNLNPSIEEEKRARARARARGVCGERVPKVKVCRTQPFAQTLLSVPSLLISSLCNAVSFCGGNCFLFHSLIVDWV